MAEIASSSIAVTSASSPTESPSSPLLGETTSTAAKRLWSLSNPSPISSSPSCLRSAYPRLLEYRLCSPTPWLAGRPHFHASTDSTLFLASSSVPLYSFHISLFSRNVFM